MSKIVLIDGHSILTRAFFGVPDLTNAKGQHTNAVYGFLNIMFKILEEEAPEYVFVAFDLKKPTFRHKMFDGYKGTRKPMPQELHEQVPYIRNVLKAMNITTFSMEGYEADDLLGTMAVRAQKESMEVTVVSGDRDLLQLATDHILIRIPKTKQGGSEIENYYAEDVVKLYGVTPSEFIDMKALMGDTADNIPGVRSIGEKTAAKLLLEFHSLEEIYKRIDEVKPERVKNALIADEENARMSKILATIDTNVPMEMELSSCRLENIYNEASYQEIKELGFKSMLGRFSVEEKNRGQYRPLENARIITTAEDLNAFKVELSSALKEEMVGYAHFLPDAFCESVVAVAYGDAVALVTDAGEITKEEVEHFFSWMTEQDNRGLSVLGLKRILKQVDFQKDKCQIFDCEVAAYLLDPLQDVYDYEYLLTRYSNKNAKTRAELLGKSTLEEMLQIQKENVYEVLALEAVAALSADALREALQENGMLKLYEEIEYPLIFVLDDMEKAGVLIHEQALKQYSEELGTSMYRLEKEIYAQTGESFNLNSPKQLGVILFEKMGIPGGKKTKTGYSTSAEVLEKLAGEYPVVAQILEYRQLAKLKSTYADGLCHFISADGRIHGTFHQTITATGRISSADPNLQNIPIRMEMGKKIREVFVPADGCVFVDADYSQIELRILAHMSGDANLIAAYNSEQDIHKITASQVFHVPLDEVTPQLRRNAKAVNFGIVYGISSFGLSQDLSISKKEAGEYIRQYFETYPGVKQFLDDTVAFAKEHGYVSTLYGRRRPIPELKSSNFMQRSFGERAAMNSAVQGTAADIMKIAMIRVYQRLKDENLSSRILVQVHDEILVEAKENEVETVKRIIKEEMSQAAKLSVSLEVGLEEGRNWLEAH